MHVSSRTLALVLTLAGAAALFFRTPEKPPRRLDCWGGTGAGRHLADLRAGSPGAGRARHSGVVSAVALAVSASVIAVIAAMSGLAAAVITMVRGQDWPGVVEPVCAPGPDQRR